PYQLSISNSLVIFSFNSIRDNLIESEKTDCEPNGFIGAGKDTSRPAPPPALRFINVARVDLEGRGGSGGGSVRSAINSL
ncbi:TPA: hypothetical protein ACHKMO_005021, partial [Escherichia coli]